MGEWRQAVSVRPIRHPPPCRPSLRHSASKTKKKLILRAIITVVLLSSLVRHVFLSSVNGSPRLSSVAQAKSITSTDLSVRSQIALNEIKDGSFQNSSSSALVHNSTHISRNIFSTDPPTRPAFTAQRGTNIALNLPGPADTDFSIQTRPDQSVRSERQMTLEEYFVPSPSAFQSVDADDEPPRQGVVNANDTAVKNDSAMIQNTTSFNETVYEDETTLPKNNISSFETLKTTAGQDVTSLNEADNIDENTLYISNLSSFHTVKNEGSIIDSTKPVRAEGADEDTTEIAAVSDANFSNITCLNNNTQRVWLPEEIEIGKFGNANNTTQVFASAEIYIPQTSEIPEASEVEMEMDTVQTTKKFAVSQILNAEDQQLLSGDKVAQEEEHDVERIIEEETIPMDIVSKGDASQDVEMIQEDGNALPNMTSRDDAKRSYDATMENIDAIPVSNPKDLVDLYYTHEARIGGGSIYARSLNNSVGSLDYYLRSNKRLLMGRLAFIGSNQEARERSAAFLIEKLLALFPSYTLQALLPFTPVYGVSRETLHRLLHSLSKTGWTPVSIVKGASEIAGESASPIALSNPHIFVNLKPVGDIDSRKPELTVEIPDKGGEIRVRQSDSVGGGILYADLRERGILNTEAGRLIYHIRSNDTVRIAFLHVKTICRQKRIASALLDHLTACMFPLRKIQVIFQAAAQEVEIAWKTFRSYASRHNLSCSRYPSQQLTESFDLAKDSSYLPNSFEILEFTPNGVSPWDPYAPLISRAIESSQSFFRDLETLAKGGLPHHEKRGVFCPSVTRLDSARTAHIRRLIRAVSGELASIGRASQKNPEVKLKGCTGIHPLGAPVRDRYKPEDYKVTGPVEVSVPGLIRMILERALSALGFPN
mmetsp:Transcript_631/g.842  ORF Transcript_631/g.842 Transcript_631/m.842 type:complete len:881 (-) Transcript_631:42-2684(-)